MTIDDKLKPQTDRNNDRAISEYLDNKERFMPDKFISYAMDERFFMIIGTTLYCKDSNAPDTYKLLAKNFKEG